jgi:methyl-accepting chemotaxis protein
MKKNQKEWLFMNWLNNLKVGNKLLVLIFISIIALIGVGTTGYYYLNKTSISMEKMYTDKLIAVQLVSENRIHARRIESNTFGLMLTTDEKENQRLLAEINERGKLIEDNLTQYEKLPLDAEDQANVKSLRTNWSEFNEARKKTLDLAMQNKNAEAYQYYVQTAVPIGDKSVQLLRVMSDNAKKSAELMNVQNKESFQQAILIFVAIIVISILIEIAVGWIITKRIVKRLQDAVRFLGNVSLGDFSQTVPEASMHDKSEFGELSQVVDKMNISVRNLIQHLFKTSEQLAAASEQLTASAEQSAQASNQVADSITEVAVGAQKQLQLTNSANDVVGQMSTGIEQVAQNTAIVSESAEKTASSANSGGEAIETAVRQMRIIEEKTNATAGVIGELEEKSKQIGQIVEAIGSIAAQTNLLALNAAIEAARAGEAGRGFAVVAEEVRKLAEQSEGAASQITDLIHEVQAKTANAVSFMQDGKKEVDSGATVVHLAGDSFKDILRMVQSILEQIREIAAASQQLTSGTDQVVGTVHDITRESKNAAEQTETISAATQEQAASMEEIASASKHLASMAENLQVEIRKFKI